MTLLKILGWILVIFLSGILLYSIKFHLGNYLLQRQRIRTSEVGEVYKQLHKEMKWGNIIFIQLAKLFLIFFMLTILLSGQELISENTTNQDSQDKIKWTEKIKSELLQGCAGNASIFGISEKYTQAYCNCVLAKTMESYPDQKDIKGRLPWDFVIKSGVDCAERVSTFDANKNNKFDSNKEKFLFSVFAFKKAFEIEPFVETEDQQKEYEALIKIGVDLSYNVSDDFLNQIHPELLNQYRKKLIQGGKYLLNGNAIDYDINLSLEKLSDGAKLVNNWGAWWNDNAAELMDKIK